MTIKPAQHCCDFEEEVTMKRLYGSLIALFFILTVTQVCFSADLGPVVSMGTPLVKMDGKETAGVIIMGTGFKPDQEIHILFVTPNGIQSDIGYALKPPPKPDKTGSWATTWNADRYVKRKLIAPEGGSYKIVVANGEYIPISHTTVFFQAQTK